MNGRIGFWRRVAAVLLDWAILCSVIATIKSVGHTVFGATGAWLQFTGNPGEGLGALLRSFFNAGPLGVLLFPLYGATEAVWGWTLGKRLLGLRICAEDGGRPATRHRVIRYLVKWGPDLLGVIVLLAGLAALRRPAGLLSALIAAGFLLALGSRRQAFHDRIARTAVFASSKATAASAAPAAPAFDLAR